MRFKLYAGLLSLAAATLFAAPPPAPSSARQPPQQQQDEQDIIEGFVTTRGASFGERPKKPASNTSAAAQPKKTAAKIGKSTRPNTGGNTTAKAGPADAPNKSAPATTASANAAAKGNAAPAGPNAAASTGAHHAAERAEERPADGDADPAPSSKTAGAVGLGYTILLVGADGSNAVVDPSRPFAAGDKIRVALETNADGYLYIFNAENDRPDALMLYPHAAIDGGSNRIAAHVRDFFPADLRYTYEFDDTAATEHLYIIFSRRPLEGVPAGEALLAHCGASGRDGCYWKPAPEQWARIKAAAAAGRVVESKNKDLAAARDPLPAGTLSRGIKIKKDEPAPAVVRINASAQSDLLLTKIQLVHR